MNTYTYKIRRRRLGSDAGHHYWAEYATIYCDVGIDGTMTLATYNDNGHTFEQIADIIDTNVDKL